MTVVEPDVRVLANQVEQVSGGMVGSDVLILTVAAGVAFFVAVAMLRIVLTIVPQDWTQKVLSAIVEQGKLNQPGAGIAFVLEFKTVAGICHMCCTPEGQ